MEEQLEGAATKFQLRRVSATSGLQNGCTEKQITYRSG
jgi:hypothetical protein